MKRLGWLLLAVVLVTGFVPIRDRLGEKQALNVLANMGRKAWIAFNTNSQGANPLYTRITKFGLNEDIDTGGYEVIADFGGDFVQFNLAAETLSVVSTSLNDTAAGTGAQQILVTCIDSEGYEVNFFMTLNGTTPVVSTQTCKFVNRAVVYASGSTRYNEGDITLTQSTSGVILGQIPIRYSTTFQLMYYVPTNRTCCIDKLDLTTIKLSGSSPRIEFETRVWSAVTETLYVIREDFLDTSANSKVNDNDFKAEPLAANEIITVAVETDTNNTSAAGTMELTCRRND